MKTHMRLHKLAVVVAGAGFCIFGVQALYHSFRNAKLGLPISSPQKAAHKLVHDKSFGNHAIDACVSFGDSVLPDLARESDDFWDLSIANAGRVAEVMSRIQTPRCVAMLKALFREGIPNSVRQTVHDGGSVLSREEACILRRCIGGFALARQGALHDPMAEDAFLVQCVSGTVYVKDPIYGDLVQALAALAIGHIGTRECVSILCEQLPRLLGNAGPVEMVEAVALCGDTSAVSSLRGLLDSWRPPPDSMLADYEWAPYYGERVLRALIVLGDYDSLRLIIAHVDGRMPRHYWVLRSLRRISGQDCGNRREQWEQWWQAHGETFSLSADVVSRVRGEVETEGRYWLLNGFTGFHPAARDTCFWSISGDAD